MKMMIIEYWDSVDGAFTLDEDPLHIEVDDIYFLARLSHRGHEVSLTGVGPQDLLIVWEYIEQYCTVEEKVNSSRVPIKYM